MGTGLPFEAFSEAGARQILEAVAATREYTGNDLSIALHAYFEALEVAGELQPSPSIQTIVTQRSSPAVILDRLPGFEDLSLEDNFRSGAAALFYFARTHRMRVMTHESEQQGNLLQQVHPEPNHRGELSSQGDAELPPHAEIYPEDGRAIEDSSPYATILYGAIHDPEQATPTLYYDTAAALAVLSAEQHSVLKQPRYLFKGTVYDQRAGTPPNVRMPILYDRLDANGMMVGQKVVVDFDRYTMEPIEGDTEAEAAFTAFLEALLRHKKEITIAAGTAAYWSNRDMPMYLHGRGEVKDPNRTFLRIQLGEPGSLDSAA